MEALPGRVEALRRNDGFWTFRVHIFWPAPHPYCVELCIRQQRLSI